MSWIKSDAIAMYPSQGRSDYYNRKARYVSEANVTVSASALTSKHGFVINGLVPSKVDTGSQLSAGSFWIRGYVFTVASAISITEKGSKEGDVLCAVLRTDESGQRVGIADRVINQNTGTSYALDAGAGDESTFYGIQIVTKTKAEWDALNPEHEECRYKVVSDTSGNYTEFYLRLALWNNVAWEQPKNESVALNGLKIDASAISVTMAETQDGAAAQGKYTATQDLATLLNKNFIVDDGVTGENGHIRIRELTTDNLSTVLVDRQPAIVKKSNATYLFVGNGTSALNDMHMQPITARSVEGWTADKDGLTKTETTHYKISGDGGLKLEYDSASIVLNETTTTVSNSLSVKSTTTLTGTLTANGGMTVSSGITVSSGNITATKSSISASSIKTTGDITSDGDVTGKIGAIDKDQKWSLIDEDDTIATGFAKTNYAINNLSTRMKTAESFTTTGLIANGHNLNNYYGTGCWGKRYYAPGGNTVENLPERFEGTGSGFHLEVLKNGGSTTTQRITIYGLGNSGNAPVMYVRSLTHHSTSSLKWSPWQEIAEAGGSYSDMTVGNYDTTTGNIARKFAEIDGKFTNLETQTFTETSDFGGTGQEVNSIDSLISVLDKIFKGEYTVQGTINSKQGFYAVGGI